MPSPKTPLGNTIITRSRSKSSLREAHRTPLAIPLDDHFGELSLETPKSPSTQSPFPLAKQSTADSANCRPVKLCSSRLKPTTLSVISTSQRDADCTERKRKSRKPEAPSANKAAPASINLAKDVFEEIPNPLTDISKPAIALDTRRNEKIAAASAGKPIHFGYDSASPVSVPIGRIEASFPKGPQCKPVDPLPGREMEYEEIIAKISDAINTQTGTCLYISGVPGTGKTATVERCVSKLIAMSTCKNPGMKVSPFDVVMINGMKLSEPIQTYSVLWKSLCKTNNGLISGNMALKKLAHRFRDESHNPPCLVILDELDLLLKRKQSVLYHFFEWTGWPNSKLIIIAIANTMDLPERYLPNRTASRMGLNRLNFKPYQYSQLQTIIQHSLGTAKMQKLFHPDALEFCARKVSAVSGDARRAINLARRAIEWVLQKSQQTNKQSTTLSSSLDENNIKNSTNKKKRKDAAPIENNDPFGTFSKGASNQQAQSNDCSNIPLITIDVINKAIQCTMVGNISEVIQNGTIHQRIMLLSLLLMTRRAMEAYELSFEKTCTHHQQLCRTYNIPIPSITGLTNIAMSLASQGLVRIDHGWYSGGCDIMPDSTLRLMCAEEELLTALKSEDLFQRHLV